MTIPDKLLKKWELLRSPGDSGKIVERLGGTAVEETINRAFREGKCRDEVFEVMAAFYEEKGNIVKQYL